MKNGNKIIVPTGYMGSGSSAITDLVDGIESVDVSRNTFEYVFLHCPNGVFDLEDKLLIGNNAVRSDEALHNFHRTMKQLYDKKYWWVGHYKEHVGTEFWKETEKYIKELTEFELDYYWYYQENVVAKMVPALIKNKILKRIPGARKYVRKPLAYTPMWVSYMTPEKFYEVTQNYLYRIFDLMGKQEKSIVLDQLLLPFNLFRFQNYFKDDVEVFVVERDPRDVFLSNKYYWNKTEDVVPYPSDVNQFCDYYEKLRKMEKPAESSHIHRIHFEDLIYKYDETVRTVYSILGIETDIHSAKIKFRPEKSINNTQLFLREEKYAKECKVIEERLGRYLYAFPYSIEHREEPIF